MRAPGIAIGLTGGIACGKSTVQAMLEAWNIPVLDTDQVAHAVMEPGEEVYQQVLQAFGPQVLTGDGRINRRALGQRVFSDPAALERLNGIVHPEVSRRWRAWLSDTRREHCCSVVSIPLLYEVNVADAFDLVLCVWAPESRMVEHLMKRGLSLEDAQRRIQAQWPVDRKAAKADIVIRNDGSLEDLRQRVETIFKDLCPQGETHDRREYPI